MNVKQIATITGMVFTFMYAVCKVVGQGADTVEKIKNIKEDAKQ